MIASVQSDRSLEVDANCVDAVQEELDRVRSGDRHATDAFVRRHAPRLMAVARRMLRCPHDCEDAVQEAFVSALRSLGSFSEQSHVTTWLHRITVNVCLMKIRSHKRRPSCSLDELLPSFDDEGRHAAPVARWREDYATSDMGDAKRRCVRQAIDQLPEVYRTVLILRDVEDFDTEATARLLKVSEGNVKVRLHRARQALRTLLEPYFAQNTVARR